MFRKIIIFTLLCLITTIYYFKDTIVIERYSLPYKHQKVKYFLVIDTGRNIYMKRVNKSIYNKFDNVKETNK
jgi:hypothetical protein